MIKPMQYMSVGVEFIGTGSGYTVTDSTNTLTLEMMGSPTIIDLFAWGLCDPMSGLGDVFINGSPNNNSSELLQVSNFIVTNTDPNTKKSVVEVSIDLIVGTTFAGISSQLYLMANDKAKSGMTITFGSRDTLPVGLEILVFEVGNRSNNAKLNHTSQSKPMTFNSNTKF
jgi:hypothetical protein